MSILLSLVLAGAEAAAPAALTPRVEPNPRVMTQKEIKAYNASMDKQDPFYIRCKRELQTGSLAKYTYSCRTNHQWAQADDTGNANARETYEAMQGKAVNSN